MNRLSTDTFGDKVRDARVNPGRIYEYGNSIDINEYYDHCEIFIIGSNMKSALIYFNKNTTIKTTKKTHTWKMKGEGTVSILYVNTSDFNKLLDVISEIIDDDTPLTDHEGFGLLVPPINRHKQRHHQFDTRSEWIIHINEFGTVVKGDDITVSHSVSLLVHSMTNSVRVHRSYHEVEDQIIDRINVSTLSMIVLFTNIDVDFIDSIVRKIILMTDIRHGPDRIYYY